MCKKIEYLLIKKKDDFCNTPEQFKSLLKANARITSITDEIIYIGKYQVKYKLIEEDINKTNEISFYLSFESKDESKEEKEIEALENIDKLLRRVIEVSSDMFYLITLWDDVSAFYGTKAYPKINEIENKMRKIIYIFMIGNIGSKWVEKYIPHEVKESIKKVQEKNDIHEITQDCLYSADFIQLVYFIFYKYPLNSNLQSLVDNLKKADKLDKDIINDVIEKYETKSNWDRFFSTEIKVEKLYEKWEELYDFRNKVAHNKKIEKVEYNKALKIISELGSAFDKCLERVKQIEITAAEQQSVEKVAELTIDLASTYDKHRLKNTSASLVGLAAASNLLSLSGVLSGITNGLSLDSAGRNLSGALSGITNGLSLDSAGRNLSGALSGITNGLSLDSAGSNLSGALSGITNGLSLDSAGSNLSGALLELTNGLSLDSAGSNLSGALLELTNGLSLDSASSDLSGIPLPEKKD